MIHLACGVMLRRLNRLCLFDIFEVALNAEEGGGRSMDRREEGAQQQGGAGELIELVGRLFGPAERGEVGSPPECAAVQHGEHSEAQAQKWNQQNGRHDMSSLCHDNPL